MLEETGALADFDGVVGICPSCGRVNWLVSWYNCGMESNVVPMRPVIMKTVVVCLGLAMAPWLTGGQEPLGRLIAGFALLLGVLLVWRQPVARKLKRGPLVVSFGLLIGAGVLSLLWTANRYSSVVWIMQWVMMGLAFRLSYAVSSDRVGRLWVVRMYLVSAALFCVAAIWMYFVSSYGRLTGTFYWPNPAAGYLLPAIMLGVDGVRRSKVGRALYAWMAATVLFVAAFLLADSRAASVVLFIILVLFLLLVKLSRRFWVNFVFVFVMAFGVSFGMVKLSSVVVQHSDKVAPGSRLVEAASGSSVSGSDRLYFLGSAFEMWFTHPLGGVGAGAFGDIHPRYQQRVVSASANVHNIYVQVLAELGLVGAVALAAVLLALMLGLLRGLVAHPELMPVAIGLMGLLLHAGLDIDASYPALLSLVGVFFGLLHTQRNEPWVKTKPFTPMLAMVILVPVVSLYFSQTWAERGRVAQADGDYELATEDFARATTGLVYNPDFVTAEGINQLQLGELDLALSGARRAEALDPNDGQHHQLEGRILVRQGDLKGAEAAFRVALALDRLNHPDYALDLAATLELEHRPTEAVQVAQTMLDQYPAAVVSNRSADETVGPNLANLEALVGNVALEQGDLVKARSAAAQALKLDPQSLRGRALMHQVEKAVSNSSQ